MGEEDDVKGLDLGAPTPSDPTTCYLTPCASAPCETPRASHCWWRGVVLFFSLGVGQTHDQTTGTTETRHQNEDDTKDDDEQDDDDTPLIPLSTNLQLNHHYTKATP